MREIKFRVWDEYLKRLSGPQGLQVSIRNGVIEHISQRFEDGYGSSEWGSSKQPLDQNRYRLMQFTGLKDRNGVEIYEGDILGTVPINTSIAHGVVEWWNGCFYTKHRTGEQFAILLNDVSDICEVIGNVYEHPQLLTAHGEAGAGGLR